MTSAHRFRASFLAAALSPLLLLAATASVSAASTTASAHTPVKVAKVGTFGRLLLTSKGYALYTFNKEKNGKIACTGSCAVVWPPLLVPRGARVPAHVSGAMGMFGTVTRPDRTRQLTFNGHALYRFQSDTKPGQVLCDGVGGWYAVRIH